MEFSKGNIEHFKEILFSGHSIDYWDKLCFFVPELKENFGKPQSPKWHPEGNVEIHICMVIDNCAHYKDITMSLIALFHDIGKGYVHSEIPMPDGTVKITHKKHELKSHDFVQKYKSFIEMCGADFDSVATVVLHHMRTHKYNSGEMSNRNKRKAFEEMKDFNLLVSFSKADEMGKLKNELNEDGKT